MVSIRLVGNVIFVVRESGSLYNKHEILKVKAVLYNLQALSPGWTPWLQATRRSPGYKGPVPLRKNL